MDWDLWSVPYDPDVIEEDALKEKCCIQVLRILITKADSEIDELEQDLIFLQSELAWIENEEWSETSYNALTAKIDSLDTSMRSLRNEDVDDVEVHLLMHTQPVERLHEVLQALLGNYFCNKDLLPANSNPLDSSFHPLKLEAGLSAEATKTNSSCPTSIQMGKDIKSEFNPKEQAPMQNLSSSCADNERQHAEKLETQPANVSVDNATSDASQHANDTSNTIEKPSSSDSTITIGYLEERSSISSAGLFSGSSMMVKPDPGEKVKDEDFVEDVKAEELKCSNEHDESENADHEGLTNSSLKGTDEPTMKNPQEILFGFTSNESGKPTAEELEIDASETSISRDSPEMEDSKEKNPLQISKVEAEAAALTEKENRAWTSLVEEEDKKGNNAMIMMLQPKEEEDKTVPAIETDLNLQKDEMKGSINSSPLNFHQVGITTTMIVDTSSSFVMKGKKRQKTVARPEKGASLDEKLNSEFLPLKKTNKNLDILSISELQSEKTESKALSMCDSEVEPIPSYSDMEKMRLPELRKVAKAHKLSRYSQLNKRELIGKLACKNGGKNHK